MRRCSLEVSGRSVLLLRYERDPIAQGSAVLGGTPDEFVELRPPNRYLQWKTDLPAKNQLDVLPVGRQPTLAVPLVWAQGKKQLDPVWFREEREDGEVVVEGVCSERDRRDLRNVRR